MIKLEKGGGIKIKSLEEEVKWFEKNLKDNYKILDSKKTNNQSSKYKIRVIRKGETTPFVFIINEINVSNDEIGIFIKKNSPTMHGKSLQYMYVYYGEMTQKQAYIISHQNNMSKSKKGGSSYNASKKELEKLGVIK